MVYKQNSLRLDEIESVIDDVLVCRFGDFIKIHKNYYNGTTNFSISIFGYYDDEMEIIFDESFFPTYKVIFSCYPAEENEDVFIALGNSMEEFRTDLKEVLRTSKLPKNFSSRLFEYDTFQFPLYEERDDFDNFIKSLGKDLTIEKIDKYIEEAGIDVIINREKLAERIESYINFIANKY